MCQHSTFAQRIANLYVNPFSHIIRALLLLTLLAGGTNPAYSQDNTLACIAAPPLPPPGDSIRVSTEQELRWALGDVEANTTIVLAPGTYNLSSTISITADNVTIRGELDDCSSVRLVGPGMRNPDYGDVPHGFWIRASNTMIANLTISDVFFQTIAVDGNAYSPHIYNVRMLNPGTQFVKVNPIAFANGVDDGVVEYSVMAFTDGPPTINRNNGGTGYTNGVDIHAGADWRISNNRFSDFHTPDSADNLVNPAVLVWNGASGTITENNVFINVDRAIAYGLINRVHDHQGGVIRNNMIMQAPGLFSAQRKTKSDASIIVWDSPNTQILHNTILNNGNSPNAIDLRWDTTNNEVSNNLTDAPIRHRDQRSFTSRDNITSAQADWFVDPPSGNLRLGSGVTTSIDVAQKHELAPYDIDGFLRSDTNVNVGANEQLGFTIASANDESAFNGASSGGGTMSVPHLAWLLLSTIICLRSRARATEKQ